MVSSILRLPKLHAPKELGTEASSFINQTHELADQAVAQVVACQDMYIRGIHDVKAMIPSFMPEKWKSFASSAFSRLVKETIPKQYRKSPAELLESSLEDPSGGGMGAVMSPAHLEVTDPIGSLHRVQDLMPQVKQNGHNLLEAAHQASSAIGSWANHLTDAAVTFLNSHHVTNAATQVTNAIHHGLNVVG